MEIQGKEYLVNATAIFGDGRLESLVQKPDRKGKHGLSQCLFFNSFKVPVCGGIYEVRPRLDFTDCDRNGDPKLDVEMYNGVNKIPYARWHQTSKTQNSAGEWVYVWKFESCCLEFKVQYSNQRLQTGCSRIAAPPIRHSS